MTIDEAHVNNHSSYGRSSVYNGAFLWNGDLYRSGVPVAADLGGIFTSGGISALGGIFTTGGWIECPIWNRDQESIGLKRYEGSTCRGGYMINGDYHEYFGIYAPGIWRERWPEGGVMIPWGVVGGWYEYDGRTGRCGYGHTYGIESRRKCTSKLDEAILDFPVLFEDQEVLCDSCANIPIDRLLQSQSEKYNHSGKVSESKDGVKLCELCSLILPPIEQCRSTNTRKISLFLEPRPFMINAIEDTAIFYTPTLFVVSVEGPYTSEKIGYPILPEAGSRLHFLLLNEWLRICDEEHCHTKSFSAELPTRVIDVSHYGSQDELRLFITESGERGTYITLSHCWGSSQPFCTEKSTLEARRKRIEFANLPKTFQDAVVVTRGLGVQYLWIDSLCIIQDDMDDWRRESARMEGIYSSAYCTIAATSATNCSEGFLHRSIMKHIKLRDASGLTPLYVCKTSEDFDQDVENGVLNRRAWVLQERALSRRTLHFTAAQTYWECGSGIQCETLGTLHPVIRPPNPLASSEYPVTNSQYSSEDAASLFQDTFVKYTSLDITHSTDRSAAIIGLELRLAVFYRTPSVYGILMKFFGKSLLWKRSTAWRMEMIGDFKNERVPSWSWMAYNGQIGYEAIPKNGVNWRTDLKLAFSSSAGEFRFVLAAPLAHILHGCSIKLHEDTSCKIIDAKSRPVGWIRYDSEDEISTTDLGFIIVAEVADLSYAYSSACPDKMPVQRTINYVLLVKRTPLVIHGRVTYRRLGVAAIQREYLGCNVSKRSVFVI
jgi:Heterokaryon incompatibility protein (HET)